MTRNNEEIISDIKQVLDTYIEPVVMQHGGKVKFSNFANGVVILEMSGACSGCSGSTATLKFGIKNLLVSMIEEVTDVDGFDDIYSDVAPYMSNTHWVDENIDALLPDNNHGNDY